MIFSIRGLYLSIVGEDKQSVKTILEMLNTIKEERRKLQELHDVFYQKLDRKDTPQWSLSQLILKVYPSKFLI